MNNIILIGMRGSGKTTVGKLLSQKLNLPCIEVDDEIVKETGMNIRNMVAQHGWDFFREKESEAIKKISDMQGVVISTGGGAVLRPANIEALKRNGVIVYLRASVDVLLSRIGGDNSTLPRLTAFASMREEVEKVWGERKSLYEKVANEIVDTENLILEEIVEKIAQRLAQHS